MNTVLITGADRGLGLALARGLLQRNWLVFAGQFMPDWPELGELAQAYPDSLRLIPLDVGSTQSIEAAAKAVGNLTSRLDMLVNNAGVISSGEGELDGLLDTSSTNRCFRINSLGPLKMTQAFLPLMHDGMRRLCYVSSEAGSIAVCARAGTSLGYCMSKTALNMGVHLLYNELRPLGYTFRLYHPGWLRSYMAGEKNEHASLEADDSAKAAITQFLSTDIYEDSLEVLDWENAAWPF